jgi:formylglycine-generating enzyme required for sulfatase activity
MRAYMKCLAGTGVLLACAAGARAVNMAWVTVGDPGNVDDTHGDGHGGVADTYAIGKYEVTNSQYCAFLNAVATADPNGLYSQSMGSGWHDTGGIARSGTSPNFVYSVRPDRGNRPVNYVTWYNALRFANWLHNGQPAGDQDATTTEDGAYDLSLGANVARKPGALVFLPSEDEWYKAAYYKGGGTNAGYWNYPTQSDTEPTAEAPPGTDLVNGSANYLDGLFVDPVYYTTEVGAYDALPSSSAYGTFDQGGNLWEWNETDISGDGSARGLRGGSYDGSPDMHAAARYTTISPTSESRVFGFRVAAVPEPAAIVMLALAGAGLLRKTRT